jgi:hypothetical protein
MKKGKNVFELIERIKINYKRGGFAHIFKIGCEFIYYKYIKPRKMFVFQGRSYPYFYHWYNTTWTSERCIEIPIVMNMINSSKGKRILEVGNVLSHYYSERHDIIDKYEIAQGVINQDVVNFRPSCKYDYIVSISTLEHVGWDETPRDSLKILRAIVNLKSLLNSQGKIVVTFPLGYNPNMDKLFRQGKMFFDQQFYLTKISLNEWREIAQEDVVNSKYDKSKFIASRLIIGIIEKDNNKRRMSSRKIQ